MVGRPLGTDGTITASAVLAGANGSEGMPAGEVAALIEMTPGEEGSLGDFGDLPL